MIIKTRLFARTRRRILGGLRERPRGLPTAGGLALCFWFTAVSPARAEVPASVEIVGSAAVNAGSAEPYFARVTYGDASTAVVAATWTSSFAPGPGQEARVFSFAAPQSTADQGGTLSVSYTEDGATVEDSFAVTVGGVALGGAGELEYLRNETEARPRSRAGYSVDAATGAQVIEETVLTLRATTELGLTLAYNSRLVGRGGPLGPGWRHGFDLSLDGDPDGLLTLRVGPEFENRFRFLETVSGTRHYVPLDRGNRYDVLTRSSSGSYTYVTDDGRVLNFNSAGQLVDYRNKVRQGFSLSYGDGGSSPLVATVRDSLTRRGLFFAYDGDGRLETVTDNDDRIVRFRYDAEGRLVSVTQPYYVDPAEFSTGPVFDPKTPVPDGDPVGVSLPLAVGRTDTIGEVVFNHGTIDYTRFADLVVNLVSPAGTRYVISDHEPLESGSRLDLEGLTVGAFQGEDPEGEWRLEVVDDVAGGSNFNAEVSPFSISFSGATNPTFYSYDGSDRLVASHDGAGVRRFALSYDTLGRVTAQDDGLDTNAVATFAYMPQPDGGMLTGYTDRAGETSSFLHDARLRLLRWTDPLGHDTRFTYNARGDVTSITDPLGQATAFSWDADGNVTGSTDPAGHSTLLYYDENRNLTRIRDAQGKESTFEYDDRNNMTRATDAQGNALVKTYNNRSQLLSEERQDGASITYGYAGNGDLSFASHPANNDDHLEPEFDDLGRMVELTEVSKYLTRYEYSPTGKLLRETDPIGNETVLEYDARDRVVRETDKAGGVTTYSYDANDNRMTTTDPLGQTTTFTYDGEDRLATATDPRGGVTAFAYDALGRPTTTTDPLGRTQTTQYDAAGNLVAEVDGFGVPVVTRSYDARGLPTALEDAFGNRVEMEYDAVGRMTDLTDPLGNETTFIYDTLDRLTSVLDPLSRVVTKHYDSDDLTTQIELPGASPLLFDYDDANRVTSIHQGTFRWRRFSYDGDGRDLVTQEQTPSGLSFNYEYDGLGRLLRQRGANFKEYTYDASGNMLTSGNGAQTITRTYDALNRVQTLTGADGREIEYEYDASNNLTALTFPDGDTVTYTYDAADQLTLVTDWDGRETSFTYDANGRITQIGFPNGTRRTMTYDGGGQLTRRTDTGPGGEVIVAYTYEYDVAGRLEDEQVEPSATGYAAAAATMTYNARYQVETYNGTAVTYDGQGRLNHGPTDDGEVDFIFLSDDSLSTVGENGYRYDEEDRLEKVVTGAGETVLLNNPHAGLNQILQMDRPDGSSTRFVYGVGLLYDVTGDDIRVYHYDSRGSTVAMSDNAGAVAHRFSYGPFGEPGIGHDPEVTPFLFAGLYGVFTAPDGLLHMRARWYSPLLRRFVARDTYLGDVRLPTSLNPWVYGLNSPAIYTDPEGELGNVLVGAIAGAIGGVVAQGVTDLIEGNEPRWQDYVGAAAGGAVTGALIGSGFGAVFAGGFGGYVGAVTTQTLDIATGERENYDLVEIGVATLSGAAAGKFAGKYNATGFAKNQARKQVLYQGLLYSSKGAVRQGVARQVAKTIAIKVGLKALSGAAKGVKARYIDPKLENSKPYVTLSDQTRQRFRAARDFIENNLREIRGKSAHFRLYEDILSYAGAPVPTSPNNVLSTF